MPATSPAEVCRELSDGLWTGCRLLLQSECFVQQVLKEMKLVE